MIETLGYLLQMSNRWNLEAIVITQWLTQEMFFLAETTLVEQVMEKKRK